MPDRSGQQLGNYRLIRLLGKGGFAEVYLGEHIYLKIPVAVKVLYAQLEGADMTGFLKEAQTIASLMHPHIVRVTDFGLAGETPYLVMDYAPNGTLRQRHPRGTRLPISTISAYVKQVAGALQYAHDEKKLVHRDIKPENMLLGRNNDILLSDFGIATVAARTTTQNTQMVAGTTIYMAPELFRGKPYTASDQYSLAIVVYEWLCGEPPFSEGDFIQLGYQHTYVPPEPLHNKVPTIPREIEQVVLTALNKEPKQRFLTVQAFANALEQASTAGGKGYVAPPPAPSPRPTPTSPAATREYTPTLQETSLSSSSSYPGKITSNDAFGARRVTGTFIERSKNPWRIGRRQVVAAIIGLVIFGISNYGLDLGLSSSTSLLYNNFFSTSIGNVSFGLNASIILYSLILLIPLFLSSVYGPWVGIAILLVGGYASDYLSHFFAPWNWYAGTVIIGFIAGLALVRTKGRYNTLQSRIAGGIICAVGLICGLGFWAINDTWVSHVSSLVAWGEFLYNTLVPSVVTLILLPILLTFYNKRVSNSTHL